MNLTNQPPHQKGNKRLSRGKARPATKKERAQWEIIRAVGCILSSRLGGAECHGRITIHHCGTGGGGRKDHSKVIPLCHGHHQGHNGIDGKHISKRDWQARYGTEDMLLARVEERLKTPSAVLSLHTKLQMFNPRTKELI